MTDIFGIPIFVPFWAHIETCIAMVTMGGLLDSHEWDSPSHIGIYLKIPPLKLKFHEAKPGKISNLSVVFEPNSTLRRRMTILRKLLSQASHFWTIRSRRPRVVKRKQVSQDFQQKYKLPEGKYKLPEDPFNPINSHFLSPCSSHLSYRGATAISTCTWTVRIYLNIFLFI